MGLATDAEADESDGESGTSDERENANETSVPLTSALWRAINRRAVVIPVLAITLVMFGLEGVTAFLPTYLHDVGGLSSALASGVYALFFVGGALGQVAAGNLSDRYGDRIVLIAVAVLNVAALVAVPFVSGLVPLAVVVFLLGTRNGIAPISNAYIIAVLPDEIQGTAWGMLRTGFFLVGSTGSIVVGWLADRGQFASAFYVIAAATAAAALLYVYLPNRRVGSGHDG
ncbi:MFS transporter [Halarchaeum acidiphilum]|uniref:MFS transporter n=1 Tax=Halarchaeum acidiphilum TaxID=489138 RepID=UPI001F349A83|nr:MFS transporter [Halarchaeum acidiphilum]